MRQDSFIVTERDVPPVNHDIGKDTQCGWCLSVIGEEHQPDCVCRVRSIVARLTFDFVTWIPEIWDEEKFEFIHNGNRICATHHLEQIVEADACVCGGLSFIREATVKDEQMLPRSEA